MSDPAGAILDHVLVHFEFIDTRRCACGGWITADRRTPFAQVRRHNATREHHDWWERVRVDWQ